MAISLGRFGVWRRLTGITPDMARAAEALGFGGIWIGGSPPGDLEGIERIIESTERIPVVTGIVNMWREGAETVAASYLRIVDRHPDRFILGVGVGHPESSKEYQRPLAKIEDYLDRLDQGGVPTDGRVLAALGPRALRMAAERTLGAHPYLTTPRHTGFAREVMGPGPLLAPEHKVVLTTDPDAARAEGRPIVERYLGLSNYRNNLLREGWDPADLEDGGSNRLVDALVLHGGPEKVAAGLTVHLDAGADHVSVYVLSDDPVDSWRRLAEVLL